jgi:hypothetical protein
MKNKGDQGDDIESTHQVANPKDEQTDQQLQD